jgi:TRAP-type uncharacterized transport system fused permease subunit
MLSKLGTADLAITGMEQIWQIWTGKNGPEPIPKGFSEKPLFPETKNIRILIAGAPIAGGMLVRKDSGMGMPPIPAYVLLAVLVAPALVQLGVDVMAAQLFIVYFSSISMITPPVCGAAYAGAALAGANFWRTGYSATRLGIVAYIVPFLFVFTPGFMLNGSLVWMIAAVVPAVLGILVLTIALSGYFFQKISPIKRVLFGLSAIGLLFPIRNPLNMLDLFINIAGGGLAFLLIMWEWKRRRETLQTKQLQKL